MAFPLEPSVTPVSIGAIATELYDPDPATSETQKATVAIQVVMSNGVTVVRHFNLADHVSPATIQQLITLAASIRTKANDEIL